MPWTQQEKEKAAQITGKATGAISNTTNTNTGNDWGEYNNKVKQQNAVKMVQEAQQVKIQQQTQSKGLLQRASDFSAKGLNAGVDVLKGAAKGALSTAEGMSSLGEKYLLNPINYASEKLTGSSLRTIANNAPGQSSAEALQAQTEQKLGLKPGSLTEAQNTAQAIGKTAEQIGEFFIPGGASTKVAKGVEGGMAALKAGKLLTGAAKLGSKAATEALLFGGQTAMQQGEINKEVGSTALMGGAMPIAGKALSALKKPASTLLTEILGKTTGSGSWAIKEAVDNPNVHKMIKEIGIGGVEGMQQRAVQEAKTALDMMSTKRSTAYKGALDKIKLVKTSFDDITNTVRDKAKEVLGNFDIGITASDKAGGKINALNFDKSTLVEGQNVVEKAVNDAMTWTENTPAGLDKLKKRLFDYADQLKSADKAPARKIVQDIAHSLDGALKKNVPGYEKMTGAYRESIQLSQEIEKALSLGDKASIDTTIRKLMSTMKQNNEFRKEMVEILTQTGGKDITGKLAASQLAGYTPKGLAGVLSSPTAGVGAALTYLNPSTWPLLVTYLGSSSPRLVAKFADLVGKAKRLSNGMLEETPALKTQIQRMFGD